MFFNSYQFLFIFLPIVLIGFWSLKSKYRVGFLIISSIIFYAVWSWLHLVILLSSITINFWFAKKISSNYNRNWLIFAIIINLLPLIYFKYSLGVNESMVLPLAISFYTFQQIAFLIDLYQKRIILDGFIKYIFFVMFFPQLVAGPIVHYNQLISQVNSGILSRLNIELIEKGILIFSIGLFKKVALADTFFIISNSQDSWAGVFAYSFGIYFDFSAYSDMAIGLAMLFGIILPINFNSPYKADNLVEFWRRWHITLSEFLKYYIYIPLGGNRNGKGREVASLILTMSIGGVWHGAGWNFLLWGTAHGIFLVIVHILPSSKDKDYFILNILKIVVTFITVSLLWVLFFSHSINEAFEYYKTLFTFDFKMISPKIIIELLIGFIIIWVMPNSIEISRYETAERLKWYYGVYGAILMFISLKIMAVVPSNSFVYFNF
ncbi:Probable poly(beta-D-mannuronate) O-acetylase [hydrothermal vent metagenome]|uniref:Probable poly(Beta-D-mannuronate) O-acetylase n=1 Tax=hydrothermal vent metagenome TaxID=652676 RepID=A0A1W1BSV9_9ZZZZ